MTAQPFVRHLGRAAALTAALLAVPRPAAAFDPALEQRSVSAVLDTGYPRLKALYEDIHAHPELAFHEERTAALLAKRMKALGFDVTEHVGKTGLVGELRNGDGPTVMVRTELDALPMPELSGLSYASHAKAEWNGRETEVAHTCGHDLHMAIWVGTASALVAARDRWRGRLMFVAQPAEETTEGAKAMRADGLFERFGKPDLGFALHVGPTAAGTLSFLAGPITATSDTLDITFVGRGGHGSAPSLTIDPVLMASRFVVDVQSVISREKGPFDAGVLTLGSLQAGAAPNVIPERARLLGTIRTLDELTRTRIVEGVRRTADAVAAMAGAPTPEVTITPGARAVVNDATLTADTGALFKSLFGDRAEAVPKNVNLGSEDYSELSGDGVPSVYFGIGGLDPQVVAQARAEGRYPPGNHSPYFAPVAEPTIRTGVTAMTLAVLRSLPAR